MGGSLAVGLAAALLLTAAPFTSPEEDDVTGAVLGGFALGWVMLAVLSVRFTDQPQRWAVAPALLMGTGGLLLVTSGSSVRAVMDWAWPPALLALTAWMVHRARRDLRSRSRTWMLHPVLGVLVIASVGGGYQTVSAAVDARTRSMPGELVDVGGHRLHLSCTGAGEPTVVLETGAGGISSDLRWVTSRVAGDTQVCVYDRAGRGWSEPADTRQDAAQIATDLHTLLRRGGVQGPYVLAGHSFGGLYALTFAARYPDLVAGMVLVDSTAPAPAAEATPGTTRPREEDAYDLAGRGSALASIAARVGLGRLVGVPTASHLRSTIEEYLQGTASGRQAAALEDLGDKPLAVVSAGRGTAEGWSAEQDALAMLSTDAVHRVVDGATHSSLVVDEEDAAATAQAVLDVVAAVRSGQPLAR